MPARPQEWKLVDDTEPLRQGDVLEPVPAGGDLHVVITADCDLARSKNAGRLTCVPIMELTAYLFETLLARRSREELRRLATRGIDIELTLRREREPDAAGISEKRFLEWASEGALVECEDDAALENEFRVIIDGIQRIQVASTFQETVNALVSAKTLATLGGKPPTEASVRRRLSSEVQDYVASLPGDGFFLGEVAHSRRSGYVAYLRTPREIVQGDVSLRASWRANGHPWKRISRIEPPYIHAMSQRFGAVFSAIGLSADYENSRASIVTNLLEGDR